MCQEKKTVPKSWDYTKGCPLCGTKEEDAVSNLKFGFDIYYCYICGKVFGINKQDEVVIFEE